MAGCINDSHNLTRLVRSRLGRRITYFAQMIDTLPKSHKWYPTRAKIDRQLVHLRSLATKNKISHIIFHYSGHGDSRRDRSGDERDGRDETILPVDHASAGTIADDFFINNILNRLPRRTHVFALVDACHSGTFMDLRRSYHLRGKSTLHAITENKRAKDNRRHVLISGCVDSSYSYDTYDTEYGASGACTVAFIRAIKGRRAPRLVDIMRSMRAATKPHGQVPQLSANYKLGSQSRLPVL